MTLKLLSCKIVHPGKYIIKCANYNVISKKRLIWKCTKNSNIQWNSFRMDATKTHVCTQMYEKLKPKPHVTCKKWKKGIVLMSDSSDANTIYISIPVKTTFEYSSPSSNLNSLNTVDRHIVQYTKKHVNRGLSTGAMVGIAIPTIMAGVLATGLVMDMSDVVADFNEKGKEMREVLKSFHTSSIDNFLSSADFKQFREITNETLRDLMDLHTYRISLMRSNRFLTLKIDGKTVDEFDVKSSDEVGRESVSDESKRLSELMTLFLRDYEHLERSISPVLLHYCSDMKQFIKSRGGVQKEDAEQLHTATVDVINLVSDNMVTFMAIFKTSFGKKLMEFKPWQDKYRAVTDKLECIDHIRLTAESVK